MSRPPLYTRETADEVIRLRRRDRLTYREIAEALKLKLRTVARIVANDTLSTGPYNSRDAA